MQLIGKIGYTCRKFYLPRVQPVVYLNNGKFGECALVSFCLCQRYKWQANKLIKGIYVLSPNFFFKKFTCLFIFKNLHFFSLYSTLLCMFQAYSTVARQSYALHGDSPVFQVPIGPGTVHSYYNIISHTPHAVLHVLVTVV